jgi:hypothetical protein
MSINVSIDLDWERIFSWTFNFEIVLRWPETADSILCCNIVVNEELMLKISTIDHCNRRQIDVFDLIDDNLVLSRSACALIVLPIENNYRHHDIQLQHRRLKYTQGSIIISKTYICRKKPVSMLAIASCAPRQGAGSHVFPSSCSWDCPMRYKNGKSGVSAITPWTSCLPWPQCLPWPW